MNRIEPVRGGCHCGATRFEVAHRPAETFVCRCSLCRKQGTLWVRSASEAFRLERPADDVGIYRTQQTAHHFCRGCGCVTYSVSGDTSLWLNARLLDAIETDRLPIRSLEALHG